MPDHISMIIKFLPTNGLEIFFFYLGGKSLDKSNQFSLIERGLRFNTAHIPLEYALQHQKRIMM